MKDNRVNWLKRAITALLFASMAAACSSPTTDEGTNTNWVTCVSDSDCAGTTTDSTCIGGVCKTADGKAAVFATSLSPSCPSLPLGQGDGSARETCQPARALVNCTNPDGSGSICTTDGALTCSGAPSGTCHDSCKPDEYVVSCGGVGPGPVPDPPAECRPAGAVPAGIAFYCCPCGG